MKTLIKKLQDNEEVEILHAMAFGAYNPSIGRALQKDGVIEFANITDKILKDIKQIKNRNEFDKMHKSWMAKFIKNIKTNRNRSCQIGHAQKAINVFLKVYYDWGKYKNTNIGKRINSFLHVPLDSYVLDYFKKNFKNDRSFQNVVKAIIKHHNFSENSLSQIKSFDEYMEWQNFFRTKYSKRPVLFDIVWALVRNNKI